MARRRSSRRRTDSSASRKAVSRSTQSTPPSAATTCAIASRPTRVSTIAPAIRRRPAARARRAERQRGQRPPSLPSLRFTACAARAPTIRSRSCWARNDSSAITGTGGAGGDLGHADEIVGGAGLLEAFDVEAVVQGGVEQRERVARGEPGVGVEAEARIRHRRGHRAQRREVRPPVAAHLHLEAGEPGAAVGARARRHPFGIGDRQRDVGDQLDRVRRAPSAACSGTPARRAHASRIAASTPARATRLSGRASATSRAMSSGRRDRGAAKRGRRRRDHRQQLGLVLARDRRQRRRLAEPGRAPPRPSTSVARTSAAAWCRCARSRSRTARAAGSRAARRRSRRWRRRQPSRRLRRRFARAALGGNWAAALNARPTQLRSAFGSRIMRSGSITF